MRVRAFFKTIADVVATIKAATIINKDRKNDFREARLPSPPFHVVTRRTTWLRAASNILNRNDVRSDTSGESKSLSLMMHTESR